MEGPETPSQASDDPAFMLNALPGCYFIVGNGDGKPGTSPGYMVHNTGFYFNDAIMPTTASFWVTRVGRHLA